MFRTPFAAVVLMFPWSSGCAAAPSRVEVVRTGVGYELRRDGEAIFLRGVGGSASPERLAEAGANAIRTWDAEGMGPTLDRAHELGLGVVLGIWLEHERHGFDADDPEQRRAQLERVRRLVLEHKDHPALLVWGVGNELELEGDIDKAHRFVEEAAALVKSLDPNHPVMTVVAEIGDDKARRVREHCPSVDILGVNSYAGIASLPERLTAQGYDGPYVVTEFGPQGHWEVQRTAWGAPFEPPSADKAAMYRRHYLEGVVREHPGRCLGSFAFLWGHKQEATSTWYGMFLDSGESTATVDAMTELWTGAAPPNRAPEVHAIEMGRDGLVFAPGERVTLTARASDPDADPLAYAWEVREEQRNRKTGGDDEDRPEAVDGVLSSPEGERVTLTAPTTPGQYRVFLIVRDGQGHAGTANAPFLVRERRGG